MSLREDIEQLVSGNLVRLDSHGVEIEYPADTASVRDVASHDAVRITALVEGIAACGTLDIVRRGTGRWAMRIPWSQSAAIPAIQTYVAPGDESPAASE